MSASPDYEVAAAAARWGTSPEAFRALSGEEQSEMVAFYRAEKRIEAVLAYEANKPKAGQTRG